MENRKIILHISEIDIGLTGGMARVAYHWKNAFESAGYQFLHIGPREIGRIPHKSLFGLKAYWYMRRAGIRPVAIIAHEPAAQFFVNRFYPTFIESHGLERRNWEHELASGHGRNLSLKTRLLYPVWRLMPCDIGLKNAHKLLLINHEDRHYALERYRRKEEDIYVFRNGVDPMEQSTRPERFTVLFNGSWIARKGCKILVEAAAMLLRKGVVIDYLLIGTGKDSEEVLGDWPQALRPFVRVVPVFAGHLEKQYLNEASVIVLPSHFEGQPLSILQAMAAGKCCITTNCCGQKDFIENGETGLLFEPGDSVALAVLMELCKSDEELVDRIGAQARAAALDRTWRQVSSEVVEFVSNHI